MTEALERTCHYCGRAENFPRVLSRGPQVELRPYGPGGAWACFKCAMATPERKAQTDHTFGAQLEAAEAAGEGVSTLTSGGPEPGFQPPPESSREGQR